MPKRLRNPLRKPYHRIIEFRGKKWPSDTHEGRCKNSDWASYVNDGAGVIDFADMPKSLAFEDIRNIKPFVYAGFWNVKREVRRIIEDIDPDLHQFVPLNVTDWRDNPFDAGCWFLLNVHVHQSSIIDAETDSEVISGYEETREKMILKPFSPTIVADSKNLSPDINLWREERYPRELFISDELYARLERIGVKFPCDEVLLK